jgi:menaquinone-dependent protoporphyrinogen IX oxidase
MKGIILYKGKYGATHDYAGWLAEELHLPVMKTEHLMESNLPLFDYIVLGSSVYVGKLLIKDWLRRNAGRLGKTKIFLFVVCGTPASQRAKLEKMADHNVPPEIREKCIMYFLRGRMNRKALSLKDRLLLKAGSLAAKTPAEKKAMLEDFDYVEKDNINPLVTEVRQFAAKNTGKASSSISYIQ